MSDWLPLWLLQCLSHMQPLPPVPFSHRFYFFSESLGRVALSNVSTTQTIYEPRSKRKRRITPFSPLHGNSTSSSHHNNKKKSTQQQLLWHWWRCCCCNCSEKLIEKPSKGQKLLTVGLYDKCSCFILFVANMDNRTLRAVEMLQRCKVANWLADAGLWAAPLERYSVWGDSTLYHILQTASPALKVCLGYWSLIPAVIRSRRTWTG